MTQFANLLIFDREYINGKKKEKEKDMIIKIEENMMLYLMERISMIIMIMIITLIIKIIMVMMTILYKFSKDLN